MKIVDVRVRFFRYRPPNPLVSSIGRRRFRLLCLVELTAASGQVGVGESWVNFPSWVAAERHATITEGIAPLLVGRDAADVIGTQQRLWADLAPIGRQGGIAGAVSQALSGVDLALWDLLGKDRGLPVYRMLGGGRQRVPVYASGLGPQLDENRVHTLMARGIGAFKIKVGFGHAEDYTQVARLRQLVGDGGRIMVDANQGWQTPNEALLAIRKLAPLGLEWVEEPLPADDWEGMAYVTSRSPVPISAGENLYGRAAFARWAHRRAFNIAQPDLTKVGGFTEAWAITQMMPAYGLAWAPHFLGGAVGLAATCHLFALVPGGIAVELDSNPNALRDGIAALPFPAAVEDGHIVLPDTPGWGLTLREDLLTVHEVPWQEAWREADPPADSPSQK